MAEWVCVHPSHHKGVLVVRRKEECGRPWTEVREGSCQIVFLKQMLLSGAENSQKDTRLKKDGGGGGGGSTAGGFCVPSPTGHTRG